MWGEWEVRTHPARSSSAENVHTHTPQGTEVGVAPPGETHSSLEAERIG